MSQRLESRSLPPPEVFNNLAIDIDNLGVVTRPKRLQTFALAAGVYTTLSWQDNDNDTRGDMWDPANPTELKIRVGGTYLFQLQVRFPAVGGSVSGTRMACLVPSSTAPQGTVGQDTQPGLTTFEGTTCVVRYVRRCVPGDTWYGLVWSSAAVTCGGTDYGGTYLMASRIGGSGSTGALLQRASLDTNPVGPESVDVLRGDVIARPAA